MPGNVTSDLEIVALNAELQALDAMAREGITHVPPASFVADFVRLQRAMLGWKQETLASFSAVSLSTVERIERGRPVSAESLGHVAVALGQDRGAFTEPRVPLTREEGYRRFAEAAKPFIEDTAVPVRPLRGQRQVAVLASCEVFLVDAGRLGEAHDDDVAELREWLDLTSFLLRAEEEGSIIDLGQREPTARRRLYDDVLGCVRGIERRGQAVALAGTYEADAGTGDDWKVRVALVAFFPRSSDPGAVRRRTLFASSRVDMAAVWRAFREVAD